MSQRLTRLGCAMHQPICSLRVGAAPREDGGEATWTPNYHHNFLGCLIYNFTIIR